MLTDRAVRPDGTTPRRNPLAARLAVLMPALLVLAVAAFAAPARADNATELASGTSPVTETGGQVARTKVRLSFRVNRKTVRFGGLVRLTGKATGLKGWPVRIEFRTAGSGRWRLRHRVRRQANGRFSARIRPRQSGFLRVRLANRPATASARIKVRSRVRLNRPRSTVKLGESLPVTGTVRPRRVSRIKLRIDRGTVSVPVRANGRFRYRWRPRRSGTTAIRAFVPSSHIARGSSSRKQRSTALRASRASYYGPGLYGNPVACGGTLRPGTVGVAHRSLPCGTRILFRHGNRTAVARVIDRGPFISSREWDLTAALKSKLGFGDVGTVWSSR